MPHFAVIDAGVLQQGRFPLVLGVDCSNIIGLILMRNEVEEFWIHLDADVLDDAVMPAVDYRLPRGSSWDELSVVMRVLITTGRAVGLNVGILNPALDADGSIVRRMVSCMVAGLSNDARPASTPD